MRALVVLPIAFGLAVGCSSGSSGGTSATLDCAWLASDNCWKMTIAGAASCVPPSTETGVLSADNATCTYAGGAIVSFTPPLVLPMISAAMNFAIANGGQECLHYKTTDSGFQLVVGDHSFTESLGEHAVRVTCPDGRSHTNANASELRGCGADAGAFGGLPDFEGSGSGTSVSFDIRGSSPPASSKLRVFNCAR